MPMVGSKPMTGVYEWAKTVQPLDSVTTLIGDHGVIQSAKCSNLFWVIIVVSLYRQFLQQNYLPFLFLHEDESPTHAFRMSTVHWTSL
jgi:hypothetical protein